MIARLTVLLVAALAMAALAVGCGGGDGDGAGGSSDTGSTVSGSVSSSGETEVNTSSLSKAAFLKKVNAICNRGRKEALSGEPPPGTKMDEREIFQAAIVAPTVSSFRGVADEIYELGAPSGDEAQIQAFLDAFVRAIDSIEARQGSIASYAQLEKLLKRSSTLAYEYGLEGCRYAR